MAWLREVWSADDVAEAVQHASPVLSVQVRTLVEAENPSPRDVRRAVLSVARYLLRSQGRATPFGLFAGVTTASFETCAEVTWGTKHRPVAGASAEWLAAVTGRLESCPELLTRLPVVANTGLTVRGDQLIVPYQPNVKKHGTGAVEVSLRHTAPVRTILAAAQAPISVEDLGAKILAEFPAVGMDKVTALLAELVARGVLITGLNAPGTETDALGYLVAQLEAVEAETVTPVTELVLTLRKVRAELAECNALPAARARTATTAVAERMSALVPVRRHPLAVDLRLDGSVTLPRDVAREVERAALALARVSAAPYGATAWKVYHQRFYERFGIGSMVPVQDVVADSGIGFPDGYPGSVKGERRSPLSLRDEVLVRLAQNAVLDGRDEVVLDEALMTSLELGPDEIRLPPHLEMGVRVHAAGLAELQRGDFRLEVVSVSRGAGVGTGRFLGVLEERDRARLASELADLPAADGETVPAQLSFPPLVPETAHVTRSPQVLPLVISLEEHRAPDDRVLTVAELAVGCDGRRMYLAAPSRGHRVEAVGMHALNLHTHTPPMARFLTELSRAQCAAVTLFDWGSARTMPHLPRLRYGRTILSPARWRLEGTELPARSQSWTAWDETLTVWRQTRRVPRQVYLTEGDRLLALDLDEPAHRVLLRAHLDRSAHATLTEALHDSGWFGGRAHEIVVPLKSATAPPWPRLPKPTRARLIGRDQGQTPATSMVLLASLYGDIRRQDTILAQHLPTLLDQLGQPPWWYVRYRDPDQHLRLRIALPYREDFGRIARAVSAWTDELHHTGLLREVRYPTSYPETGRWGSGLAWGAAEAVFRTDSSALLAQLRQPVRPHHRALVAAHTVAIACAFLGSTEAGMRWLIDHVPAAATEPVPRHQFAEAVRLADPSEGWAALRAVPGGGAIVEAWTERDRAVSDYRRHLPGPDTQGIDADDVLGSLLHVHFVRAVAVNFPEEAICLHLARAAALAWTARASRRPA
ncbi:MULTISPECIES: lantibiotic dehydratase [unclassified Kitasatospora]|uniref:lantibiotic dehydratase n=1 Tax=unclassified Kitasatospora TaxID=2633591 RepID=UPI0024769C93|nr:lantibiotic dehydratase [Kitasatospora sp. MAP12-44]